MLHQWDDVLQQREILETSTHGFRFGVKSNELSDRNCEELISILDQSLNTRSAGLYFSAFISALLGSVIIGLVYVQVTLFVVLV